MLESKHYCRGSVKQIPRCPEKSVNVTNCARILQSHSRTGGQIPEPSGIGSRELLSRRLRLADQNTSQLNVLRRNLSVVYTGLQEKTDQLTYARNPQTRPAKQPAQTNMIELEDIIIII